MDDIFAQFGKVLIGAVVLLVAWIFVGTIVSNCITTKTLNDAICLEDTYELYYNGTKVSDTDFQLEALDKDNISIKIDDKAKEIHINDIQQDTSFIPIPIIPYQ